MPSPLITIIIPVYNTEPYLRKCLDSVCGQTYGNLEVICVNDGSTDGSQAILEEYAARDARVKVLAQENSGQAAARNRALDAARGEYVMFVDSDDWLDLDTCEQCVQCMDEETDVVFFSLCIEGVPDERRKQEMEAGFVVHHEGRHAVGMEHMNGSCVYVACKLYRRSVLENGDVRFPNGILYEDTAFYFMAISCCHLVYGLNKPFYHYLQREDSTMNQSIRKTPRAIDHLAMARFAHEYFVRHGKAAAWRPALANLFNIAYSQTERYLPEEMLENMRTQAWQLACDMGITGCRTCHSVQALRAWRQGRLARLFHGIYGNRDSYGLGRFKLWTVVHTQRGDVHHCCGHRLFATAHKEQAGYIGQAG